MNPETDDAPTEAPITFDTLALDPRLLAAVAGLGFTTPTPIQAEAIPRFLEGADIVGGARTGSGKTAAFGLPVLQRVLEGDRAGVKALVLAPTRELALQVTNALLDLCGNTGIRVLPIYGGTPYPPQIDALRDGVDVVVGTPGRLIDHLGRGRLDLSGLDIMVLDEADEMLRMGFIEDVETLLDAAPRTCQRALFSATMPNPIRRIASRYLTNPVEVQVEDGALTTSHIAQRWISISHQYKLEGLDRILQCSPGHTTLVFARTRAACAQFADALAVRGYDVDALHGDLNQAARERVLGRLRAGRLNVVVATDVAARGIDVEHISQVINLDMPDDPEGYVHRIGRTGRAGRAGRAVSFVTGRERSRITTLERTLDTALQQVRLPDDDDIARAQQQALADRLAIALERERDEARAELAALCEERSWTVEDVAVAALAMLGSTGASARPVPEPTQKVEPPAPRAAPAQSIPARRGKAREASAPRPPARGRPNRTAGAPDGKHRRGDSRMVELFLPMGEQRGLRPKDVMGALTNGCGVPGSLVGRITITETQSFVGLPQWVAEALIAEVGRIELRGKQVPMSLAKT